MTRIERLKKQLSDLQSAQMQLFRMGKYPNGQLLQPKIDGLKKEIATMEYYEPKPLKELATAQELKDNRICEGIVEIHMAADFLSDCAFRLKTAFRKLGLDECQLFEDVRQIERLAAKLASHICTDDMPGLRDMMTSNEQLIESLHKVTDAFLDANLNITYNRQ